MFLSTNQIFEQLVEGKSFTLRLDSKEQFDALHSQLRVYKSRNNKKFMEYFGESLIKDKVISGTYNPDTSLATFTLSAPVKKKTQWQVVASD